MRKKTEGNKTRCKDNMTKKKIERAMRQISDVDEEECGHPRKAGEDRGNLGECNTRRA